MLAAESQLQFAQFPMKRSWRAIRDNVPSLRGASVVLFVGSDYDSWLIYTYNGHEFSINDEDAELKFHVQDRDCPPQILDIVCKHFAWLEDSPRHSWLRDASAREGAKVPFRTKRADLLACRSRFFAELPFCKPWVSICDQLAKVEGIQMTTFSGSGPEIWVGFFYEGEQFRLHGGGESLLLSADDPTCPDSIVLKVIRQFTEILSAD
jgi:hypothetical protein